jgi:hypothetical protein
MFFGITNDQHQTADQLAQHGKTLSRFGASEGGKARAAQLSSKHLSKIAQHAANIRWGNKSKYKSA